MISSRAKLGPGKEITASFPGSLGMPREKGSTQAILAETKHQAGGRPVHNLGRGPRGCLVTVAHTPEQRSAAQPFSS